MSSPESLAFEGQPIPFFIVNLNLLNMPPVAEICKNLLDALVSLSRDVGQTAQRVD